jgi:hypothetical protein
MGKLRSVTIGQSFDTAVICNDNMRKQIDKIKKG